MGNKCNLAIYWDHEQAYTRSDPYIHRGKFVLFTAVAAELQGAVLSWAAPHSRSGGHMKATGPIVSEYSSPWSWARTNFAARTKQKIRADLTTAILSTVKRGERSRCRQGAQARIYSRNIGIDCWIREQLPQTRELDESPSHHTTIMAEAGRYSGP